MSEQAPRARPRLGGWWRLWIALSTVWALPFSAVGLDQAMRFGLDGEKMRVLLVFVLAPPLALLAVGLAARWVISGFRQGRAV